MNRLLMLLSAAALAGSIRAAPVNPADVAADAVGSKLRSRDARTFDILEVAEMHGRIERRNLDRLDPGDGR